MSFIPPQAAWYLARSRRMRIAATLAIAGTPVTSGTEGVAYDGFTVSASGGAGDYVFSVAAGALPAGITLDPSSGAVAGTPVTAGEHAGIVIRVTDIVGNWAELPAFTLTVAPAIIHEGLMAGATPGIVGSGGSFPTGWALSGGSTATVEILSAPKVVDNVECFDFEVSGEINPSRSFMHVYFPAGFGGVSDAAPGQVWRVTFYLMRTASEGGGQFGNSRQLGEVNSMGMWIKDHSVNSALHTSGPLSEAITVIEATLDGAGVERVHGGLNIRLNNSEAPAACTFRLSCKLERVS